MQCLKDLGFPSGKVNNASKANFLDCLSDIDDCPNVKSKITEPLKNNIKGFVFEKKWEMHIYINCIKVLRTDVSFFLVKHYFDWIPFIIL